MIREILENDVGLSTKMFFLSMPIGHASKKTSISFQDPSLCNKHSEKVDFTKA